MKVFTFLLVLLFGAATADASINPLDVLVRSDATTATVVVRTLLPAERAFTFELRTPQGKVVLTREVAAGAFLNRRFAATSLPTGRYVATFTDERGRTEQPFTIDHNGAVRAAYTEASTELFPRVTLDDAGQLVVNVRGTGGRPVAIELSDPDGKTVLKDKISGETGARRAYQLSGLAAGDYVVRVDGRHTTPYTTAIQLR